MNIKEIRKSNLKRLIDSEYDGNASALASDAEFKQVSYIYRFFSEGKEARNIGDTIARRIEKASNKPSGWLDNVHSDGEKISALSSPISDHVRIEKLSAQLSMGSGVNDSLAHDEVIGHFETTKKWIKSRLSHATSPSNIKLITGYGDSMEPTFNHGDMLFCDTGIKKVDVDAIYAIRYDNQLYIKRVQRMMSKQFNIISDNKEKYPTQIVDNHNDFEVVGRIIGTFNFKGF